MLSSDLRQQLIGIDLHSSEYPAKRSASLRDFDSSLATDIAAGEVYRVGRDFHVWAKWGSHGLFARVTVTGNN